MWKLEPGIGIRAALGRDVLYFHFGPADANLLARAELPHLLDRFTLPSLSLAERTLIFPDGHTLAGKLPTIDGVKSVGIKNSHVMVQATNEGMWEKLLPTIIMVMRQTPTWPPRVYVLKGNSPDDAWHASLLRRLFGSEGTGTPA